MTLTVSPDLPCRLGEPMQTVGHTNTIGRGAVFNPIRLDNDVHFALPVEAPEPVIETLGEHAVESDNDRHLCLPMKIAGAVLAPLRVFFTDE